MIEATLGAWGLWAWLLPVLMVGPGIGFAKRFRRAEDASALGFAIDASWMGMAITWFNVALVREAGIEATSHAFALVGLAVLWTVVGWVWSRGTGTHLSMGQSERVGVGAVVFALVALGFWRGGDLARPLHGYWHMEGADEWLHEALPVSSDRAVFHGWPEAGAYAVVPEQGGFSIRADAAAEGRLILAVQGPLGSQVKAGNAAARVDASVTVHPEEGPVRRYLEKGVAAIAVDVDMEAGDTLTVQSDGERVFVLPGADAVWSLHAAGVLRYVHYYQLLNQVENQVWAQEMLQDRWATLNQPPGWSPLLSLATVLLVDDMPAAAWLFLWVLLLLGCTSVRLGAVLAPEAHPVAMLIPAAMVLSHGLLMFEPGSFNFPDSLYAAAVLAVALAIAEQRLGWIAWMGIAAGLLRWPGVILSTIFVLVYWRMFGPAPWRALRRMWALVLVGAILAVMGTLAGELHDLLFILYFETFPEHWHGDYAATSLLPRVPGFYALWLAYTGGGMLLALSAWAGPNSPSRRGLRWIMTVAGIYSLMLATIDHHPTHYFLPLVALTGVALMCASASFERGLLRWLVPATTLIGVWLFLWFGDVGIQPVEDMVVWLGERLD